MGFSLCDGGIGDWFVHLSQHLERCCCGGVRQWCRRVEVGLVDIFFWRSKKKVPKVPSAKTRLLWWAGMGSSQKTGLRVTIAGAQLQYRMIIIFEFSIIAWILN